MHFVRRLSWTVLVIGLAAVIALGVYLEHASDEWRRWFNNHQVTTTLLVDGVLIALVSYVLARRLSARTEQRRLEALSPLVRRLFWKEVDLDMALDNMLHYDWMTDSVREAHASLKSYNEELDRLSPLLASSQLDRLLKPAQLLSEHASTILDDAHSRDVRIAYVQKYKTDRRAFIKLFLR